MGIFPECFILFSNPVKRLTHILRFNPKIISKDGLEALNDIDDCDVHISWGSSSSKYVMICNTKKSSTYGSLYLGKTFNGGVPFKLHHKLSSIVTSCYAKKCKKLFLLNELGKLFYRDMIAEESDVFLVKSSEKNLKGESNWLRPSSGSRFFDLEITQDESIYLLRSEVVIDCFDCNFIKTHTIPLLDDFRDFKTLIVDNEIYLLRFDKKNKCLCTKIIIPKEEIQIESSQNVVEIIDGNPILDVWHLGIIKFGTVVEETQILKGARSISYYTDNKENKKIEKYFMNLKEVKQNF